MITENSVRTFNHMHIVAAYFMYFFPFSLSPSPHLPPLFHPYLIQSNWLWLWIEWLLLLLLWLHLRFCQSTSLCKEWCGVSRKFVNFFFLHVQLLLLSLRPRIFKIALHYLFMSAIAWLVIICSVISFAHNALHRTAQNGSVECAYPYQYESIEIETETEPSTSHLYVCSFIHLFFIAFVPCRTVQHACWGHRIHIQYSMALCHSMKRNLFTIHFNQYTRSLFIPSSIKEMEQIIEIPRVSMVYVCMYVGYNDDDDNDVRSFDGLYIYRKIMIYIVWADKILICCHRHTHTDTLTITTVAAAIVTYLSFYYYISFAVSCELCWWMATSERKNWMEFFFSFFERERGQREEMCWGRSIFRHSIFFLN